MTCVQPLLGPVGQPSPGMILPSSADVYGVALLGACVSMVCAVLLLELLDHKRGCDDGFVASVMAVAVAVSSTRVCVCVDDIEVPPPPPQPPQTQLALACEFSASTHTTCNLVVCAGDVL